MVERGRCHSSTNGLPRRQDIFLHLVQSSYLMVFAQRASVLVFGFDAVVFAVEHFAIFEHSLSTVIDGSALVVD
jgi:hypothetical protein